MKAGEAKKLGVLTPTLTSTRDAPFDLDFKPRFVTSVLLLRTSYSVSLF